MSEPTRRDERHGLRAWLDTDLAAAPDRRPAVAPAASPSAGPDGPDDPATLLRFPCRFPVKAMGRADSAIEAVVREIIARHAPGLPDGALTTRPSRGGNWVAITVVVEATSRAQLDAIYRELTAHELVAYAL